MLIEDVLGTPKSLGSKEIHIIQESCSQFLTESAGLPLFKALPRTYGTFHKVKARMKKRNDNVGEAFNKAFETKYTKLSQRAIFAYTQLQQINENVEPFYVFPINGYKFLYSKEVTNSSSDYKEVIDTLFEQFDNSSKAVEIVTDLLKYTYSSHNLHEGLSSESEIILYGIPYYYAVRVHDVPQYTRIISPSTTQ